MITKEARVENEAVSQINRFSNNQTQKLQDAKEAGKRPDLQGQKPVKKRKPYLL